MPVIAIDGPAGAGKSTIARRLARVLGWAYLDTGAMYRALTLAAFRRGLRLADGEALTSLARRLDLELDADGTVRVDGEDVTESIRGEAVTAAVSVVAQVPAVREVMVSHQRRFATRYGRIVAEGRDIGTVVFPDAELKVYLDADPAERARRRLGQWGGPEDGGAVARVQAGLQARDHQDRTRAVAPLRPAPGAWILDTSAMTLDEVFGAVESRVRSTIRPQAAD